MSVSRKEFLKKACVSGICLCGFGSFAFSETPGGNQSTETKALDGNNLLIQEWISSLLSNLDIELDEESIRKIIKKTSIVHYNNLKMDEMLSVYVGDMDKFVDFIEKKWGWKIVYDKTAKVLIADENKNTCVCPISNFKKGIDLSAMCYCSEGFAEKMFSTVAGVSASATVISSIRRGEDRCKYKIVFA